MGVQNRYRGGAIAQPTSGNSNEFVIPNKILDGLGTDIDIVASTIRIGSQGFKEGFYFIDLGAHGVDDLPVSPSIGPKPYRVMGEQGGTDERPAVYPEFGRN